MMFRVLYQSKLWSFTIEERQYDWREPFTKCVKLVWKSVTSNPTEQVNWACKNCLRCFYYPAVTSQFNYSNWQFDSIIISFSFSYWAEGLHVVKLNRGWRGNYFDGAAQLIFFLGAEKFWLGLQPTSTNLKSWQFLKLLFKGVQYGREHDNVS